jgi:glycosyltransferase involved in cell wall biosynthesis
VLLRGCREAAARYTIERMAHNFADGIESALRLKRRSTPLGRRTPAFTVAVVLRTFLPYHVARVQRLREALVHRGIRLCEIEVASQDSAYGFAVTDATPREDRFCCFPGVDYQSLGAQAIHRRVKALLESIRPDVVVGHATPFPEGMAAIAYRNASAARVYVVDDAWQATDRSTAFVRRVKRVIHRSVDGTVVSSAMHARHYAALGVPEERSTIGWSVVDNDKYAARADACRRQAVEAKARLGLPARYFLFVGRFLERKGISDLLRAYGAYRTKTPDPWSLVLVGGYRGDLPGGMQPTVGVQFAGRLFGGDLIDALALAGALVVPSLLEQWGLVINEAMAAGTPVVASHACGGAQLIREGESGFTYVAGDIAALVVQLERVASMTDEARVRMGDIARRDISGWGLDRFVGAIWQALQIPRRAHAGIASSVAVRLWKGRVRAY